MDSYLYLQTTGGEYFKEHLQKLRTDALYARKALKVLRALDERKLKRLNEGRSTRRKPSRPTRRAPKKEPK